MLKKLTRYYHTLKHLKPIQIRYQLWYRLRNKSFPVQYRSDIKAPKFQKLNLESFPNQYTHYLGENRFQFLNLEQNFKDHINWNYHGHGKLWVYHLNYFDYLHQPEIDWETGKKLIDDFLENPPEKSEGMEPYPISLRTINWIKFLSIYKKYPQEILDSLYTQYQMLTKKLEYHLLGNHLLENGFSLLFGAVLFKDEKLIKRARKILKKELDEQILEDGGHFELSPMYHLILLQRALDGYNLLKNNEHYLQDIEQQLEVMIQRMVGWLKTIMFSNGDIPMLNDSVGGQALEPKVVLEYADQLGFISKKVDLSDSGYRKFEFGDFEMVADVGNVGPSYQSGHAHSDTLNFVLYHRVCPIIVDRGISTYEKNETREEERGTASHNTVMLNDLEQTDVWGGFRVGKRAFPNILEESNNILKASHDGYDSIGAKHIRAWKINENKLEIIDTVKGDDVKAISIIHFHPEIKIEQVDEDTFTLNNLILSFENHASVALDNYSYCLGFNTTQDAQRLRIIFLEKLKTAISK